MSNQRAIDQIRESVLEQMQSGTSPWQKPWIPGESSVAKPYNAASGRYYTGWANMLSLYYSAELMGFESGRWLTFKQALAAGSAVRKGEQGTKVEFWKQLKRRKNREESDQQDEEDDRKRDTFLVSKVYTVFNEDQLEAPIEEPVEPQPLTPSSQFVIDMAEAAGAKVLRGGGDKAYYKPSLDLIRIPDQDQFRSDEGFIETLIHELIHWTKGAGRTERKMDSYASEELVAEAGAFLAATELNLPFSPQNNVSYLAGWASRVSDPKVDLDKALSEAQKASRFLIDSAAKAGVKVEDYQPAPASSQVA